MTVGTMLNVKTLHKITTERSWYLDAERDDGILILDNADLIQSVAAARQTVWQLLIGQVETIDILQDQQTLGIDDDDR